MQVSEGFPGQRLHVLAPPLVGQLRHHPATRRLLVTDSGYFPHASKHGRQRLTGVDQVIVIVCSEGSGWARLAGDLHPVAAGQVLVLPPGVAHEYLANEDDPWTIWWFHAVGDDVPDLLTRAGVDVTGPVLTPAEPHRLVGLVDEIIARMASDDSTHTILAASGAAWHLMALLASRGRRGGRRLDPVAQATELLRDRVREHISVADLASTVGLSASHFSTLFRRATGYGVLEYQTRQRMARARELLDTTDLPIAGVAEAVGYEDAFYFSRRFSQVHGMSPRAYRASDKG